MIPTLAGAFVAGLVGSPHCIGMCGGFASACATDVPRGASYHVGRLTTYAGLGALAGALGHLVPGPTWVTTAISGTLLVGFALSLAGVLPSFAPTLPGLGRLAGLARARGGTLGAWGLGAATALLPCGLVWAALAVPVSTSSPTTGALAMVAFGVGTTPLLAAASLGLNRILVGRLWARRVLALGVLVAGLWSVGTRSQAVADDPSEPPACHGH